MTFKELLIALKIPRLLVESILVFSSVYFALILEADRSKDFEREKFIVELGQLKRTRAADSIFYSAIFGNEANSFKKRAQPFIVAVDSLENLSYDLMREKFYDFYNLHVGVKTAIPEQVATIRGSYHDLIDDPNRLNTFLDFFRTYDRLAEFDEMILDFNSDFWMNKATNYKLFGDYYRGPELEKFLHSQEFRIYAYRMSWLLNNYHMFGEKAVLNYNKYDSLILEEISYQKKAIKGIF